MYRTVGAVGPKCPSPTQYFLIVVWLNGSYSLLYIFNIILMKLQIVTCATTKLCYWQGIRKLFVFVPYWTTDLKMKFDFINLMKTPSPTSEQAVHWNCIQVVCEYHIRPTLLPFHIISVTLPTYFYSYCLGFSNFCGRRLPCFVSFGFCTSRPFLGALVIPFLLLWRSFLLARILHFLHSWRNWQFIALTL